MRLNMFLGMMSTLPFVAGPANAQPGVVERTSHEILEVALVQNTSVVPPHDVFELTFWHDEEYANPFADVTIEVTFESPGSQRVTIGGFHYGSSDPPAIQVTEDERGRRHAEYLFDKQEIWKARFSPQELGLWRYSYQFATNQGAGATGRGSFRCVEGRKPNHGFLRQHPDSPYRWVFEDSTPYFPVGFQECINDRSATGSVLDEASLEGPFRTDRTDLVWAAPGMRVRPDACGFAVGALCFRK